MECSFEHSEAVGALQQHEDIFIRGLHGDVSKMCSRLKRLWSKWNAAQLYQISRRTSNSDAEDFLSSSPHLTRLVNFLPIGLGGRGVARARHLIGI